MDANIEILFGIVLITIFAFERFNTPSNVRASTTAGRYYLSIFLYLLIYLVTFLVFTNYPGAVQSLRNMVSASEIDIQQMLGGLFDPTRSTPIFVALVLSLLVPKLPIVTRLDERLRKFLHKLALIPYEAIRRSHDLQSMQLSIPQEDRAAVIKELLPLGFDQAEIDFDSEDQLFRDSLKIVHLLLCIRGWDRQAQFLEFMQTRRDQLNRLEDHFDRYLAMIKNLIELERQIEQNPEIDALRETQANFRINMQVEYKAMLSDICDFVSHAILACCLTSGNMTRITTELGFIEDRRKKSRLGRTVNQSLTLFSLLLLFVLTSFILLIGTRGDLERVLLIGTMIVSIYSAALVCALAPKQAWGLFKPQEDYYPVAGYLLSGLMAMACSLVISLFFKTLIFAKEEEISGLVAPLTLAWEDFSTVSYPWILLSLVTAISTAFLADWKVLDGGTDLKRRALDAVVQATVLVIVSMIVYLWLIDIRFTRVPSIGALAINSGGIGLLIGFFVPSWYRNTYGLEDAREQIRQLRDAGTNEDEAIPAGVARIGRAR